MLETKDSIEKLEFDLKYRPRSFDAMVGNSETLTYLKKLFENNSFPKFVLFTGPPGAGKTTAAYISAISLLCQDPREGQPCGRCKVCEGLTKDLYTTGKPSPGFNLFTFDMGLNSDQEYVNNIARNVSTKSFTGRKVFIIEELQRVSKTYQDSLLRSFEYIPDGSYVIVTTSEPYKLTSALKSRAKEIKFTYPTMQELYEYVLKIAEHEEIKIDKKEVKQLINYCEFNPRQVLKNLETIKNSDNAALNQIINKKRDERVKTAEFFNLIAKSSMEEVIEFIASLDNKATFLMSIKYVIKDLIKSKYISISGISKEEKEAFESIATVINNEQKFELLEVLAKLPYMDEEDAEVNLLLIAHKLSSKIQYEIVSKILTSAKPKGEDLKGTITNIEDRLKSSSEVIDLNDL